MHIRSFFALLFGGVALVSALPEPLVLDAETSFADSHATQYPIKQPVQESFDNGPPHLPHLPHHPPHRPPTAGNKTVYEAISDDDKFTLLTKAINYVDEIVSVLNDPSTDITFFAVPDSALPGPRKRPRHGGPDEDPEANVSPLSYDLVNVVSLLEDIERWSLGESDRDKRKEFLKGILRAILSYHIVPSRLSTSALVDNTTYATKLELPHPLGSRPLRIRVQGSLYPTVNLFSKIIRPNLKTANGIVHVINHLLLPPPSVFQELYWASSSFSILTSALQRTGLTDALDLLYVHGKDIEKGSLKGTPAVTVFAPRNRAFERLPKKLRLFLFSPFGTGVLRKLLQFHIVPGLVIHSDYVYNKSADTLDGRASYNDLGVGDASAAWASPFNYQDAKSGFMPGEGYHTNGEFELLPDCDAFEGPNFLKAENFEETFADCIDVVHESFSSHEHPDHPPRPHEPQDLHCSPPPHNPRHFPPASGPHHPPHPCEPRDWHGPPPPRIPWHLPPTFDPDHPPHPYEPRDLHCSPRPRIPRRFLPPNGPGYRLNPLAPLPPPPPRFSEDDPAHPPLPCPPKDLSRNFPLTHDGPPLPPHCHPHFEEGCHHFPSPSIRAFRCSPVHILPPHVVPKPCHPSRRKDHPRPGHASAFNLTLPTLLANQSLHLHVTKLNITMSPFPGGKPHKVITKLFVDHNPVAIHDLIASNGAVHVIGKLLIPRKIPHHPHHNQMVGYTAEEMLAWESWEEWLPQWAAEV